MKNQNKTKFTPGPWKIEKHCGSTEVWNQNTFVAKINDDHIGGHTVDDKANAALISAAPDMYEALETILGLLVEVSGFEVGTGGPIYKSMNAARVALKKARGES